MAQLTFVQSNFPIFLEINTCSVKLPLGKNFFVNPSAYGGGLEEIHIEESPIPSLLTPPPQGVGTAPFFGTTQNARYRPILSSKLLPLTVIIEPTFGFAVETWSDWPSGPLMVLGEAGEAFAGVIEIVNAVNTKSDSNFLMGKFYG